MPSGFSPIDVSVLIVYILASVALGLYHARKQSSLEDYFLAERSVPPSGADGATEATRGRHDDSTTPGRNRIPPEWTVGRRSIGTPASRPPAQPVSTTMDWPLGETNSVDWPPSTSTK